MSPRWDHAMFLGLNSGWGVAMGDAPLRDAAGSTDLGRAA